jgi:hypothetical protein
VHGPDRRGAAAHGRPWSQDGPSQPAGPRTPLRVDGRYEADVAAAFRPIEPATRRLLAGQSDAELEFLAEFIADLNCAASTALSAT